MDFGLCDGNYFDYENDEEAILREFDLADEVKEGECWEDPAFPADGRAIYFDKDCPPKGSLPAESLTWIRICSRQIERCTDPVLYLENAQSSTILQGALGNTHFVNALRHLTCDPKYVHRLVVSSKYAEIGLYTIKISKAGKWRYVHIDDRIPCRQSGRVHFSRNFDPNETFAMLIEKAYAKVHGCYEALLHGLMEKTLHDLTDSSHVKVVKRELVPPDHLCGEVWKHLEDAMEANHLVTCRRIAADPFSDKNTDRLGIKLGTCYQVVDCVSAHAKPTGTKDALDVAMVCIRNLHAKGEGGRFVGRWCYGHPVWAEYPEIGRDIASRTEDIETKAPFNKKMLQEKIEATKTQMIEETKARERLASDSDIESDSSSDSSGAEQEQEGEERGLDKDKDPADVDDESVKSRRSVKSLVGGSSKKNKKKSSKKKAKKGKGRTHYDPFSDIVLSSDSEEEDNFSIDKFLKAKVKVVQPGVDGLYWLQVEDFVELFNRVYVLEDLSFEEGVVSRRFLSKWVPGDYIVGSGGPPLDPLADAAEDKTSKQKKKAVAGESKREVDEEQSEEESQSESDSDEESDDAPIPFADNPMYPFVVSEPTFISVALYQADRRWTVSRLGVSNPGVVSASSFAVRGARIEACMNYERAVGFVILDLTGNKVRVTTFSPQRIVDGSDYIQFSNVVSKLIHLDPGRYCLVPFTDVPVDNRILEYILRCSFREGTLDFEVKDLVKERPIDDMPSDDEDDAEQDRKAQLKKRPMYGVCPMLLLPERWEWEEEVQELGSMAIYEQVSDLAYLLRAMKKEVRSMQDSKLKIKAKEVLRGEDNTKTAE